MLFRNDYDSNYEELSTYYPRFYLQVREMDAILKAHGYVLDGLEDGFEKVLANCFIDTMDEDTIKDLEDFLDIKIYRQRSLEDRRSLLKSFFIGSGKISSTMIEEMIKSYTGASVECLFEPFDDEGNNRFEINVTRGEKESFEMEDIMFLLEKKIPAHIEWHMSVVYDYGIAVSSKRTTSKIEYRYCGEQGLYSGATTTL